MLDHSPPGDQVVVLQIRPAEEEGNYFPVVAGTAKEGKGVSSQQKEASLQAEVVDHCWKVGMKGTGRVVVDHCRTALIAHNLVEDRRNPGVGLAGVVTLMVEADGRKVLIAVVVHDLDVALAHYFLETRNHCHSSERVRIHFLESHPDSVTPVIFANQLQLQRSMSQIQVTDSIHSAT